MGLDLRRGILVALDEFAQEGHLSKTGAELVVDIAGDSRALLFQRFLLSKALQLAVQFLS